MWTMEEKHRETCFREGEAAQRTHHWALSHACKTISLQEVGKRKLLVCRNLHVYPGSSHDGREAREEKASFKEQTPLDVE